MRFSVHNLLQYIFSPSTLWQFSELVLKQQQCYKHVCVNSLFHIIKTKTLLILLRFNSAFVFGFFKKGVTFSIIVRNCKFLKKNYFGGCDFLLGYTDQASERVIRGACSVLPHKSYKFPFASFWRLVSLPIKQEAYCLSITKLKFLVPIKNIITDYSKIFT